MLEMLVFIFGVHAFTFGKVSLPGELRLSGWRARIAALFLMAPLPVLLHFGREFGEGVDDQTALLFYGIMDVIIVVLGILGATLFASLTRQKVERLKKKI